MTRQPIQQFAIRNPRLAAARFQTISDLRPTLAIVLGSGFHATAHALEVDAEIPYAKLPGFPQASVTGHVGKALLGTMGGTPALVLSGRAHYYEGYAMEEVTFPIRALAAFGIQAVLLTNAAGGINRRFRAGDFMALSDHINFMGVNPLRGSGAHDKSRFVDLTRAYDPDLNRLLKRAAREAGCVLRTGVYLAVSGPSYETPAEIRAFARLGADAVGMSTVPEAIVARQCGLRVAAVSCITNLAAGRSRHLLSHADVLAGAEQVKQQASRLLSNLARFYGRKNPESGTKSEE
ncbi:MAG: purine-nucleoside phosphorylase [Verrucomicrobia bacterium]|nr:MAG: purine-nucleoside phosphorylase [Verrucomicrobiota bacterium]